MKNKSAYYYTDEDYDRIDRMDNPEDIAIAAIAYNYGISEDEAIEEYKTIDKKKLKEFISFYFLRDIPYKLKDNYRATTDKSAQEVMNAIYGNTNIECSSDNLLDMDENKVVDTFINTLKEYVDEFYNKVTTKCSVPSRGITARYSTGPYGDFYMDYSCLYNTYSKQDAKLALEIFKKYVNIISMYLDTLKFKYTDIQYEITKTIVSSARIGKGLYVYNFPFELPDEYYENGEIIGSTEIESSTEGTKRKATDIIWDVEIGEDVEDEIEQKEVLSQLPTELDIPDDIEDEDIADYLSDLYGWLVEDFDIISNVENNTTIESSTSTGYSHFINWYDSLTEKGQDAVDDLADSEGLPEYEDCSDADLNWLIEQFNNEYKTQYEKEFGMNDDPDYLNIKKVSDFLGKEYPDFVEPGTNGYFCKWGDETAVQEYGYDKAQRLCDEIFDKTGVEVNISGNGEFVVTYYR